jgi:hypothetical protein
MKKLLVLLPLGLISCYEPNVGMPINAIKDTVATKTKDTIVERSINVDFSSIDLDVVIVDGCEYLYGPWGNATVFTHKGNCKNHIYK